MNATGESDLQNYYDMIAQEQESKLRPILNKLLPVLCMDVFGAVPDDLDFEFDPVSEPSDQERSDLAKRDGECGDRPECGTRIPANRPEGTEAAERADRCMDKYHRRGYLQGIRRSPGRRQAGRLRGYG